MEEDVGSWGSPSLPIPIHTNKKRECGGQKGHMQLVWDVLKKGFWFILMALMFFNTFFIAHCCDGGGGGGLVGVDVRTPFQVRGIVVRRSRAQKKERTDHLQKKKQTYIKHKQFEGTPSFYRKPCLVLPLALPCLDPSVSRPSLIFFLSFLLASFCLVLVVWFP